MQGTVLLVVADPMIRKHLSALIGRHGYLCQPTPSLDEAVAELRRQAYPVAILDIDLLGHDPAVTARQFRGLAPGLRLVGLDSVAERHLSGSSASPFDAIVAKPFLVDPLLRALESLLASAVGPAVDEC